MASGDAYDVFISYARSDGAVAADLNSWLRAQGLSTFFDRSELRPGLRWIPGLEDAIGRSRAVAILVGPHGIGNTQQYERELALVRQSQSRDVEFPVIPVLMPGCDSPPTGFLQLLTWVDLSKERNIREPSDSLEALRAALRGESVAASAIRGSICPYRGLEPFREEDAAFFCGRGDAVRELVARAHEHRFVAVVGPSGSGKSSLVLAGLLPELRRQGLSTMWDVVTLRPGKWPLHALAEVFGHAPDDVGPARRDDYLEEEAESYRAGDTMKLARIVERRLESAPERPDRLLIYVDQWEELYAMAPAPEDKARFEQHSDDVEKFIALLAEAAASTGSRANIVLTVRADFYNPLIGNPLLAAVLPKQQVNIPPMSRDDLKAAIETPAKLAGVSFAPPQLVDQILDEVGLEEGRLPLLQFALKETWDKRAGDRLTAEAYSAVGGVGRAIEKTAEGAYDQLTPAQQDAARRLFLRLVTPGEGDVDTRARGLIPDDPQQREIIDRFANPKTRLLVTGFARLPGGAEAPGGDIRATVEVAHEALIQRWPTLRKWVAANRENLRARAAILRAKMEWEENGETQKFLLDPGVQLERGRALLESPGDVPVDDIKEYVGRSIEKGEHRLAAEREAAEQAKTNLRDMQIMQSRYLATEARQQHTLGDAGTAVLFALEALPDAAVATVRPYIPEAELQLDGAWRDLCERLVLGHEDAVNRAAFSPDGRRIVTASDDRTARIWDAATGQSIGEPLRGHGGVVWSAAFSSDGQRIVTASDDRTARIWGAATCQPIGEPLNGHDHRVTTAAFSPDGQRIVTASNDRTARIWDAATGQPIGEPLKGHHREVMSASFSPDGQRIVTASADTTAQIWDAGTGQPIGEPLRGHENILFSAAFSPDGTRIVTASYDKTVRVWDAATGQPIGQPLKGHQNAVVKAAFSPDGQRIVTASWDKTARTWDAVTGQPIGEPLKGHEGEVISAAFSPDGRRIVTASNDNTARIWDAASDKPIGEPLTGHKDRVDSAAFSFDGQRIVTASDDGTARIWDAVTGQAIGKPLKGHKGTVKSAAFSPDDKRVVTASDDGTARIWDATSGKPIGAPLKGHDDALNSAAFSPDGQRIVTASEDKTARIWNAASGKPIGEPLRGHEEAVRSAAFSPNGERIVTASEDKTAGIWDGATGQPIGELKGHDGYVVSAAFSPDGKCIVTASYDKTARIWDAATRQPIGELKGHEGALNSAAFSPDGKRIGTASYDKTARIWDAATGQPVGELKGHEGAVSSAVFSPDGKRIVTASRDKTALIWDVFPNTQALVSRAKAEVPRCLAPAQRKAFFLAPKPPAWCIEMEKWPYDTPEWKQWLADTRAGKNPPLPAAP
jgi:WD40 repeat protein/energy-coupling factor transporter ATP-binding protein EcfA2